MFKNGFFRKAAVIALFVFVFFAGGCSAGNANTSSQSNQQSAQSNEASQPEPFDKSGFEKVTVSRAVDGDTLVLSDGRRVRFIGVDSPEYTSKVEPYGKEASDFTKGYLTGKTVYLEKDVSETDKYGRLLRYVWISIPASINDSEIRTKMFNAILVLNGYAQIATYPPDVKYQDYFIKYNSEARDGKKGLWSISESSTANSSADEGKGLIKGNINSKGEKIYHVPGGKYYDQTVPEQWFNTEEEAQKAGYRKSKL